SDLVMNAVDPQLVMPIFEGALEAHLTAPAPVPPRLVVGRLMTDAEVRAMNVDDMLQGARDTMTVSRVYGEPIERNGVMLIPAADIMGGGGGGSDSTNNGGGGFGVSARPVGTWIIRGDEVTWEPAIDVNRMALRGMVVAIVFLLVVRSLVKSFARRG
ncbi:MAG: hypothetical protein WEI16_05725, partial [Chloroflexota bacterium]